MSLDAQDFSAEDLALVSFEEPAAPPPAAEPREAVEAALAGAKQVDDTPVAADEKSALAGTALDDAPLAEEPAKAMPVAKSEGEADWRADFADAILAQLKDKLPEGKVAARRTAILNQLGRYKTQTDYMTAGFAAQERIRSGEMRSRLPEDATDEDRTEWRKENGLPEKPDGYDIPKVPGHKWTDADKPLIDAFKDTAHGADYTQDQVNKAVEWYVQTTQKQAQDYYDRVQQIDSEDGERMRAQLRAELGADYKPTSALLRRGLEDRSLFSEDAANALVSGRYIDRDGVSRRLINNPDVLNMLTSHFRDTYGDASFIRGDGRTQSQNVIEEADRILKEDYERYHREGWADKAQAALEEQEKLAGRRGRRAA